MITLLTCCLCFRLPAASGVAQDQAAQGNHAIPASALTTKTVQAVGYEVGTGSTKVDLKATKLMPPASGEARVEIKSNAGRANVEISVKGLSPASTLGAECMTYVVWVVTPEPYGKCRGTSPQQKWRREVECNNSSSGLLANCDGGTLFCSSRSQRNADSLE
jgi:hypothetical protein